MVYTHPPHTHTLSLNHSLPHTPYNSTKPSNRSDSLAVFWGSHLPTCPCLFGRSSSSEEPMDVSLHPASTRRHTFLQVSPAFPQACMETWQSMPCGIIPPKAFFLSLPRTHGLGSNPRSASTSYLTLAKAPHSLSLHLSCEDREESDLLGGIMKIAGPAERAYRAAPNAPQALGCVEFVVVLSFAYPLFSLRHCL